MKNKLSIFLIFITIFTLVLSSCPHDTSNSNATSNSNNTSNSNDSSQTQYTLSYNEVFPDHQNSDRTVTSITITLSWKISTKQILYLYCENMQICNATYYTREHSGIGFYTGSFQWQASYVFYLKTEDGTVVATCTVPVSEKIPNGSSSSSEDPTASSPNTIIATSMAESGYILLSWLTYSKIVDIYKNGSFFHSYEASGTRQIGGVTYYSYSTPDIDVSYGSTYTYEVRSPKGEIICNSGQVTYGNLTAVTLEIFDHFATDGYVELVWSSNIEFDNNMFLFKNGTMVDGGGGTYNQSDKKFHFTDYALSEGKEYRYVIRSTTELSHGEEKSRTIVYKPSKYNPDDEEGDKTISDEYFWGTWINMSTGKEFVIEEKGAGYASETRRYTYSPSSNTEKLEINGLNLSFNKMNKRTMTDQNNIPYFRKGGTDLKYSLTLVGDMTSSLGRAASSSGLKVTGKSKKYTSYKSSDTSNTDGKVTLSAPVAGDEQTVTVLLDQDSSVTVDNILIENDGSNMGKIIISEENSYSLKVTGNISIGQRANGFCYAGKTYTVLLTITNNSNVVAQPSFCKVSTDNSLELLSVKNSADNEDVSNGFAISTLQPGGTRKVKLEVKCPETAITSGYLDTGIDINIQNTRTGKEWTDFVPLRFHKGTVPVSIAAKSGEGNTNSYLKGFVIYPDGNSSWFSVNNGNAITLSLPTFDSGDNYILVFSGAQTSSNTQNSTEIFYTVNPYSEEATTVVTSGEEALTAMKNIAASTEEKAKICNDSFESYIGTSDICYWKIPAGL